MFLVCMVKVCKRAGQVLITDFLFLINDILDSRLLNRINPKLVPLFSDKSFPLFVEMTAATSAGFVLVKEGFSCQFCTGPC